MYLHKPSCFGPLCGHINKVLTSTPKYLTSGIFGSTCYICIVSQCKNIITKVPSGVCVRNHVDRGTTVYKHTVCNHAFSADLFAINFSIQLGQSGDKQLGDPSTESPWMR